jgi:hypothetical protein
MALVTIWFILVGTCVMNYLERRAIRKKRAEQKKFAHCQCGERMSEWFIKGGNMWHPDYFGCGWVSPWSDHQEYRTAERLLKGEQ